MVNGAAVVAECERRGYTKIETLAVLALALDQAWTVVDTVALDRYQQVRDGPHSTIDAFYNIAASRALPPNLWQAFKNTLYQHIHEAEDLYDGKDVPVTTKDQVAQIIIGEAKARNHTRDECLAEMSALYQESQWDETVWDSTHVTFGVAQQDGSYSHRFEGAAAQVKAFFDKLDVKRTSPGHGDIWLNICWLQQAPNWPSAQYWWDHGRQAYLSEIKSRIATVTPYLDKYWPTTGGPAVPDNRPGYNEYPMWSPNNSSRGGTKVDLFLLHTQEGDGNADSLARFLGNEANQVSYHYTISQAPDNGVTVVDVVDTNSESWSVLSANPRSINLCFAGSRAAWSRADWLNQSRAIDVAAYIAVQDCKKYGIAIKVLAPPYNSNPPGISDHKYVTQWLHDGTHTDVGDNFPWDVFTAAVTKYASGAPVPAPAPQPGGPLMALTDAEQKELLEGVRYIKDQLGPGFDDWGPDGDLGRNTQGQRRTFRAGVAAMMRKLGA